VNEMRSEFFRYGLIAAFTLARMSGGMGSILWTVFACSMIFFISSASVGADVSNGQFLAMHLNDGIFSTSWDIILCLFIAFFFNTLMMDSIFEYHEEMYALLY